MNKSDYLNIANELSTQIDEIGGMHKYFLESCDRLWKFIIYFDLEQLKDRDILEIGPFYSYTPVLLKKQGNRVSVFEGEDPAIKPLVNLYAKMNIHLQVGNLLNVFSAPVHDQRRLPFKEAQFDAILCWETIEHFNFNPVHFVRDMQRMLKPGGIAYMTVPNHARLEHRLKLLLGNGIGVRIEDYFKWADYYDGRFLGFHWREYVLGDFQKLFSLQGFTIKKAGHLQTFQYRDNLTTARKLKRLLGSVITTIVPSFRSHCVLIVQKPG